MKNPKSKFNTLFEEYLRVVKEATRAFNNGESCDSYEPWLKTCVEQLLVLKNAS